MKILSISIAAYNVENTICRCLESLIDESIIDFLDVIVINDGSTDSTIEKVQTYVNHYPNSLRLINKENGGYGSTINISIKKAKGKYFKLLDGDDCFIKENISEYIKYLSLSESDIVISPYYQCDGKNKILIDKNSYKETNILDYKGLKRDSIFAMHEMAVKTSLYKNKNIKISEHRYYTDQEFIFHSLSLAQSFSYYSYPIYLYSIDVLNQTMSFNSLQKHRSELILVFDVLLYQYNKQKNTFGKEKNEVLFYMIVDRANCIYSHYIEFGSKYLIELKEFDDKLKSNMDVYNKTYEYYFCYLLRKTNFKLYPLLHIVKKVYNKYFKKTN